MENSEEFQPGSCSEEISSCGGGPKKQQQYVAGANSGKWSQLQNAKYIVYIEYHKDKMRSREKRRVSKLYRQMSKFIATRNALQCRSHHQKLEDRYLYPNKIIAHYKLRYDPHLHRALTLQLHQHEALLASTPNPAALQPQSHLQTDPQPQVEKGWEFSDWWATVNWWGGCQLLLCYSPQSF